MGETADQTRAEIVQLRSEMTEKVTHLRHAAERPVRIAQAVAVGAAVLVVAGGVALVVTRARRRAEQRSLRGRVKHIGVSVRHPIKAAGKVTDEAREKLRGELEKEMNRAKPLHEKLLEAAARAAATAAIGAAAQALRERSTRQAASRTP